MRTVRVSIQDEHTLVLQEDANKGDLIDLSSLHETDIDQTTIKNVVASIKKDAFDSEVRRVRETIEHEKALEAKIREQELINQVRLAEQGKDAAVKLAVAEAVATAEQRRIALEGELKNKDSQQQLLETSLKEKFQAELKTKDDIIRLKDEEIEFRKDMKARLSTKMVGESLEQHCEIEFEKLRSTAFHRASFGKDNDASGGSKGDYIYRETDEHGTEIISIMFEMKNESDETSTKKKNEDFLKELDRDRREKNCEYAVLVSLLEADSDLYNAGIVDKSHIYDKMYVVRPQFFIPIITLLRNAAMNSLQYKSELALVREQNIDVTNFEKELSDFQLNVSRNTDLTFKQFEAAIGEIDKSIDRLTKAKESLMKSGNNLRIANNKIQDISVKRLTRGNPTMQAKFDEVKLKRES